MLDFMSDHSKILPTLWIQGQCEESRRIVEVGCERFFNLAGYVSSPKRTNLGVRNYERLAMLSCLLQKVYVDEEWVAQEYLSRCKSGNWKESEDEDALKCWNLERIIQAELIGAPEPIDLTMDEFANADTDSPICNYMCALGCSGLLLTLRIHITYIYSAHRQHLLTLLMFS